MICSGPFLSFDLMSSKKFMFRILVVNALYLEVSGCFVPLYQNERELKRERRKQSNRESARRSRLRKQVQ